MIETKLLYLEDYTSYAVPACVIAITDFDGKSVVVLDQTVFYPQGGGQPYDKGTITSPKARFSVEEVRYVAGIVKHIGHFDHGIFSVGDRIVCTIDAERRNLHSRLHSAGHLIDVAVTALQLPWKPAKAFHFAEGPYVEYEGLLPDGDKEALKARLEEQCNRLIEAGGRVEARLMSKDELARVCPTIPENMPHDKPLQVVLCGGLFIPCGGTHVSDISQLKKITIRKLKIDGNKIRIAYDIER